MTCEHTRQIQAYLDGELTREQRKELARHLEHCIACRKALSDAKRLATWNDLMLSETFEDRDEMAVEIDVEAAWARFEARLAGNHHQSPAAVQYSDRQTTPVVLPRSDVKSTSQTRSWLTMAKQYKKWIAGAVAAVAVASVLTVPSVQAAGDELLSMMRVQNLQTLQVSDQDLHQIQSWITSGQSGEKSLGSLGNVWVTNSNNGMIDHQFRSIEEARSGGVIVPDFTSFGYKAQMIDAASNFKLTLQLDTDKANHLLQQLGANTTFDSKLNGQKFSIDVPSALQVVYGIPDGGFFSYEQFTKPELDAPQGVDLRELRNTLLKMPFIPQNIASQLSSVDNWENTLPIPVIEGRQTSQKVTVNGVQGILVVDTKDQNVNLYWQKDGKVNHIQATPVNGKQVLSVEQILQLAEQVK